MIRSVELQGARVATESGQKLGHVDELHIRDGELVTLVCGGARLRQRLWPSGKGHKIAWSKVLRLTEDGIVVADDFAARG